jgi:aryl-alcohol dehydrogenase-like predicted oxidoreductase
MPSSGSGRERGVAMATVAMAWLLKHPVVSAPIVGATKPQHLTDAAAALDLELTEDDIRSLEQPYTPRADLLLTHNDRR